MSKQEKEKLVRKSHIRNHKAQKKQWYFTKQLLVEAAEKGPEWDFNRQLNPEPIKTLPEDQSFPVELALKHYFRSGQPTEEHIRFMVIIKTDREHVVFVDVPKEFFNRLPYRKVKGGTVWH